MNLEKSDFFSASLIKEIKEKFYYVDKDMHGRNRLFFDNAGGSFRLKSAVERLAQVDALPDCPELHMSYQFICKKYKRKVQQTFV